VPSLFVTCRRCQIDIPTGIAIAGALGTVSIYGVRHRCPRCQMDGTYYTPEYHLPAGSDERPPLAPGAMGPAIASSAADAAPPSPRPSDLTLCVPHGWLAGPRTFIG